MNITRRHAIVDDVEISDLVEVRVDKPVLETVKGQVVAVCGVLAYLQASGAVDRVMLVGTGRADRVVVHYDDGVRVFPYTAFLNLQELP